MHRLLALLACASVAALSFEGAARADEVSSSDKPGVTVYEFKDLDKLVNTSTSPQGLSVAGGHHAARTLLVRPRTNFVREMMKSIEEL